MKTKLFLTSMMICLGSMSGYSSNSASSLALAAADDDTTPNYANAADDNNILNSWVFGFEPIELTTGEKAVWYLQHKDQYSFTTEKAFKGTQSLKYCLTKEQWDALEKKGNLQAQGTFDNAINATTPDIPDGNYICFVSLWLDETKAPDGVTISFQSKKNDTFASVGFNKLNTIDKGKWVTLSKGVTLEGMTSEIFNGAQSRKISVSTPSGTSGEGIGTCYIDDIRLVAAKIDFSKSKYATLTMPYPCEIPEGLKVYSITGHEGNVLTKTEVTDFINGNKPYLVYNTRDTTVIDLPTPRKLVNPVAVSDTWNVNAKMAGCLADNTAQVGDYVLQIQNGKLGFYRVETNDFKVGCNRAVLRGISDDASVKALFIDGDLTPVRNIEAETTGKTVDVYSVSGVLVRKGVNAASAAEGLPAGVYVAGGKKIMVK